ncbi:single-stranded DNA-specific DHH superfamily exonuclease [Methanohalophilus levihalophilus]|uniref:single-stranded-DNA-specific exonuclease RecJ n=1 Tax=Methanohalophilus levihalophilus TaxID=1431282 RepID=UPI001FD9524C|nr:DHH family phosphoesterase [Methanohalophilus levihalophilus]MBP2031075.1 single-stranded DNA-specific DHH superfamily exonuclease [Methanohalophilus levihalophilus]
MEQVEEMAARVAEAIKNSQKVRLISHNDADGITSVAIICSALLREGKIFHTTILGRLDQESIDGIKPDLSDDEIVVFCDMGSGQPEIIGSIDNDVVVIDHHIPVGDSPAKAAINPHYAGIDGATHMCAATTAYMVARALNPENIDLGGIAITGAVGDKQLFDGANGKILEEIIENGVISIRKGLKIGDGDIAEVLMNSPEPYLDITGDSEKIENFMEILGITGNLEKLDEERTKKLTSAIAMKLTKRASPEAIDAAIGDVYLLNKEIVENVYDLVDIANCCGKMDKPALALSVCMGDEKALPEALQITKEYKSRLVHVIRNAESTVQEKSSIRYIIGNDMEATGIIAGTLIRYAYPDRPFVTLNRVEEIVKVSGRGTRALVNQGLDLAVSLREASAAVGGNGGGHNIASGAAIPRGKEEEFLNIVDEITTKQLGGMNN